MWLTFANKIIVDKIWPEALNVLVQYGLASCASAICREKNVPLVQVSLLTAPWPYGFYPFSSASQLLLHTGGQSNLCKQNLAVSLFWLKSANVFLSPAGWVHLLTEASKTVHDWNPVDLIWLTSSALPHSLFVLGTLSQVLPAWNMNFPVSELQYKFELLLATSLLYSLPVKHCLMLYDSTQMSLPGELSSPLSSHTPCPSFSGAAFIALCCNIFACDVFFFSFPLYNLSCF